MADDKTTLLPPIIDDTITAFELTNTDGNGDIDIVFYFNGEQPESKQVRVKITDLNGDSHLKNENGDSVEWLLATYQGAELETISLKEETPIDKYKVNLNLANFDFNSFPINSPMLAYLATYNNGEQSEWSAPLRFYMIAPITTSVYMGLSAEEAMYLKPRPKASLELSPTESTELKLPVEGDKIRISAYCDFSPVNGVEDNDTIAWFQAKINKVTSAIDTEAWKSGQSYTVIEDSGQQFVDRYEDEARRAFKYTFETRLETGQQYLLMILFSTNKGYRFYEAYSFTYNGETRDGLKGDEISDKIYIQNAAVTPIFSNGCIRISSTVEDIQGNSDNITFAGVWEYSRAIYEEGSKPLNWQMIAKKNWIAPNPGATTFTYDDVTVESGIQYKYRVAFYSYSRMVTEDDDGKEVVEYIRKYANAATASGKEKWYTISSPVSTVFEDIFLCTKDQMLKIKLNPTVTNLKRNIVDVITPTLGGEYPFIRRNGRQKYKTFSLGGLISFEGNDGLFLRGDELTNTQKLYESYSSYEREIMMERIYRNKVMDFLYSDQILLFKSPTEGNMFIKLHGIGYSPEQKLGRKIGSFTAQATEAEAATAEIYLKYFGDLEPKKNYIISRLVHKIKGVSGDTVQIDNTALEGKDTINYVKSTGTPSTFSVWGSWATNNALTLNVVTDEVVEVDDSVKNVYSMKLELQQFEF